MRNRIEPYILSLRILVWPYYAARWENWASLCNADIITHASKSRHIHPPWNYSLFHIYAKLTVVSEVPQTRSVPYWGVHQLEGSARQGLQVLPAQLSLSALHPQVPPCGFTIPNSCRLRAARGSLTYQAGSEVCCSSGHTASSPQVAPGNSLALFAVSWISLLWTGGDSAQKQQCC